LYQPFFFVANKKEDNRRKKLNTATMLLKVPTYQVSLD